MFNFKFNFKFSPKFEVEQIIYQSILYHIQMEKRRQNDIDEYMVASYAARDIMWKIDKYIKDEDKK